MRAMGERRLPERGLPERGLPERGLPEWGLPAVAAAVVSFSACFFANGFADAPLVWIGGIALVAGAVALAWARPPGGTAVAYLGCLFALALWCGLTMLWSDSPDQSWGFTNRSLAYAGFALLGVLVGTAVPRLDRVAAAATLLVALVIGWALLAKCVPALYEDYGRVARLRAPLDEWNMLALVCVVGVVLALWLVTQLPVAGVVLLELAVVALLLTYSRFGVALACLAAAGWVALERERVESIAALALAGGAGAGVFGIALALPGITSNGQSHAVRAHDGWVFLLVVLGGAVAVAAVAAALTRLPPLAADRRRLVERVAAAAALAAALAGLAVSIARANTIWREFTNPVASQTVSSANRLGTLGSGNRWTWWREAWDGFTAHPGGGTGAGTFRFTDLRLRKTSDVTTIEPHNTPLQFLSETGIVGFLLYAGAAAALLAAAWRRRGGAGTALGLAAVAYLAHSLVNYDWIVLGVSGPLLLLGGVVVARPSARAARRQPLLAAAATVFALACVYSIAAPWLAERAQAQATSTTDIAAALADLKRAHSYDPLSTSILGDQAALSSNDDAVRFYRDALALEPANGELWYELGSLYASAGDWRHAAIALDRAWHADPLGPAGRKCGLKDQAFAKTGRAPLPASCRAGGSASTP